MRQFLIFVAVYLLTLGTVLGQTAPNLFDEFRYKDFYDPAVGFEELDADLVDVFIKIAGSLEHHQSPEPYLRYVLAEYQSRSSRMGQGRMGDVEPILTEEYVDGIMASWNQMREPLQMDEFARLSGIYLRHAVLGFWHQTIEERLSYEPNLNETDQARYRAIVERTFLEDVDMPAMELFYAEVRDKLTEQGKQSVSFRFWNGTRSNREIWDYMKELMDSGSFLHRILREFPADAEDETYTGHQLVGSIRVSLALEQTVDLSDYGWMDIDSIEYAHNIKQLIDNRVEAISSQMGAETAASVRNELIRVPYSLCLYAFAEHIMATNSDR